MKFIKFCIVFALALIVGIFSVSVTTAKSPPGKTVNFCTEIAKATVPDVQNGQSEVILSTYQYHDNRRKDEFLQLYSAKQPVLPTKPKPQKRYVQLE